MNEHAVARAQGVSVRYLQKHFERANTCFSAYLIAKRSDGARAMLIADRETSVMEIAMANGFRDVSNFYRLFKKEFGEAPNEMRRRDPTG